MGKSTVTWIDYERRREVLEADGRRGFSQVRTTQTYLRSVEEAEREKPRRARESGAVAGIQEQFRLRKTAL